jgi:DNA-binding PucR family transcriptional regulator
MDSCALPTLQELLMLDCFMGAEVISGRSGLSRFVVWSHVSELLDIGRLVSGGELLLTTGMALSRASVDDQTWYLRTLAAAGITGLVLELVQFIRDLEDEFVEEAESLHLPLIIFRSEVRFEDIMRTVHARILLPHSIRPVGGIPEIIDGLEETGRLEGYIQAELGPLMHLPYRPRRTLLTTLRALMATGLNVAETARTLQVRRQTVYYRLQQLEGLIGPNLHDPERWISLSIALHAHDRLEARAMRDPERPARIG